MSTADPNKTLIARLAELEHSTVASEPFHEGDLILRTKDRIDYYVYRVVLGLASPFFKSMFSLQQPKETHKEDIPVVCVTEDSVTLDGLLRYCYPVHEPAHDDLAIVGRILEAAIKYDMEAATSLLKYVVRNFMHDHPLHAYAICCDLRCSEDAILAASVWSGQLALTPDTHEDFSQTIAGVSWVPEMKNLSAGCYYRLLQFLRGTHISNFCDPPSDFVTEASSTSLTDASSEEFVDAPLELEGENNAPSTGGEGEDELYDATRTYDYAQDPSARYPFTLPDTDLIVCSGDGAEFKVHWLLLKLRITRSNGNTEHADNPFMIDSNKTSNGVPVVTIPEDAGKVAQLLALCYPSRDNGPSCMPRWSVSTYCDALRVVLMARRYGMLSIVDEYRAMFEHHLLPDASEWSLDLFCLAACMGWDEELGLAAASVANGYDEVIGYTKIMEVMPAGYYHHLLSFCHRIRRAKFACMASKASTSQWLSQYYQFVNGLPTRMIPSVIAERASAGSFDLVEAVKQTRILEEELHEATKEIRF